MGEVVPYLWMSMREWKMFRLLPIVMMLVVFAGPVIVIPASATAPFICPLF